MQDTQIAQSETLEAIAAKIADDWFPGYDYNAIRRGLRDDILSALVNERERCAKVGDKYIADMRSVKQRSEYGEGCLNAAVYITKAIREGR